MQNHINKPDSHSCLDSNFVLPFWTWQILTTFWSIVVPQGWTTKWPSSHIIFTLISFYFHVNICLNAPDNNHILKETFGGSAGKESACDAGNLVLLPVSKVIKGNSNPFHYSCLENSMDRGAWWATIHGITKSLTRLRIKLNSAANL